MAQIKIYGERRQLRHMRDQLSRTIHDVLMATLDLPSNKRFQRFIGLEGEDFIHPPDRSERYTIIEISLFEGRSDETKRALLTSLMQRICEDAALDAADLEITLFETPRSHWGIRGEVADRLALPYEVTR